MSNVNYNELCDLTGHSGPSKLCAYLSQNRIAFKTGKHGRPWTTQAALDHSLIGGQKSQNEPVRIRSVGKETA